MAIVTQPSALLGKPEETPEPLLPEASVAVLAKLNGASTLSEQLHALSKDIGLRDRELMKLTDVSRATLSRWRKEGDAQRPEPLDDIRVIAVLLIESGAMRPPSVAGWLRSRNRGLSWQRPLDVLKEGDFSLVIAAAEAASGARIPVKDIPQSTQNDDSSFSAVSSQQAGRPPEEPR
jgi:transcriptional regulator with XRE-family HTH domain